MIYFQQDLLRRSARYLIISLEPELNSPIQAQCKWLIIHHQLNGRSADKFQSHLVNRSESLTRLETRIQVIFSPSSEASWVPKRSWIFRRTTLFKDNLLYRFIGSHNSVSDVKFVFGWVLAFIIFRLIPWNHCFFWIFRKNIFCRHFSSLLSRLLCWNKGIIHWYFSTPKISEKENFWFLSISRLFLFYTVCH